MDRGADAEATYEWDAEQRLAAVNSGNESTHFTYDGLGRRVGIRKLKNGSEVSTRRLVWCDNEICEERTPSGEVSKRFFAQGMEIRSGPNTGVYYTRDHLGSIRELIDSGGAVRARYAYDPFGRRTRWLAGDVDADFGFAGMFWALEASLNLTLFRAFDPDIGRWLSRDPAQDPLLDAETNLFCYVLNNPVNAIDPLGLRTYCGNGKPPILEHDCKERAGGVYLFCLRETSELEPGDYRNYRREKCKHNYEVALRACPRFCF